MKTQQFKVPEGTSVRVSEESGRVVIEFVPELKMYVTDFVDGEIYSTEPNGKHQWIIIAKDLDRDSGNPLNYHVMYKNHEHEKGININARCVAIGYSIATEPERQQLFTALEKEGLVWNPDTKKVEKKRWRAEEGKNYWSFSGVGVWADIDEYCDIDNNCHNSGFHFRTEPEAKAAFDKVKELLLSL